MMVRFSLRVVLCSLLVLLLSVPTAQAAKQRLLLGTSTVGGSYYILGGTWAKTLNDKLPNLDISVEVTGGPDTNIPLIEKKEMELGLVTAWKAGEHYNGDVPSKQKAQSMRAFIPLYASYLQIFTLKSTGITKIRDIEGKHVSTGPAGSSSFLAGRAVVKALGIKAGKVSGMPAGQQLNTLRDNQTQLAFVVGGVPGPTVMEIEATHDVTLIPLEKADMTAILKDQPYWTQGIIPKGAYKSATADIPVVSFWNFAVAHKDLSEDVVYNLTKETFNILPELANAVRDMGKTKPEDILFSSVPLHKGAIKFYREKGVKIPDNLIPAEAK
ncbi:TAXI family TRAP transporter solute-binding subunit [Desulfovibrio sp. OttesenSCG-928-O18]|nr:TAXI family TRAP transporter solute-binding subunit [Desulfovibrio sp. OttesenSCG-928-O18]